MLPAIHLVHARFLLSSHALPYCCVVHRVLQFRKYFELPILAGREPDASAEQVALGEERSRELSSLTNRFILRRTNKLLSQHLPPKVVRWGRLEVLLVAPLCLQCWWCV